MQFIKDRLDALYSTINPGLVIWLSNGKKIICVHGGFDENIIEFATKKENPPENFIFDTDNLWTDFCRTRMDNCPCKNPRGRFKKYKMIHKKDSIYKKLENNDITVCRGHQFNEVFFFINR